jgi:hypothetical protein
LQVKPGFNGKNGAVSSENLSGGEKNDAAMAIQSIVASLPILASYACHSTITTFLSNF